jgi:2-amino-4-hydroxy-6-hydroxymethyldihydropteridine diphosphokinase
MTASDRGSVFVFLGLGSNQGDRLGELRRAVDALATNPRLEVAACSRIWETEPVGPEVQDPFLNACIAVRTDLAPLDLLDELKRQEAAAGRNPDSHLKPRPIDLDILLYGDLVVSAGRLSVPHPELRNRAFVLEPLAEIAGDIRLPDSGETIAEACAKIRRKSGPWVRLYDGGDPGNGVPGANKEERGAALALHRR